MLRITASPVAANRDVGILATNADRLPDQSFSSATQRELRGRCTLSHGICPAF